MPGRVWRDTAPAIALAVLAIALVAVSFAPWYGLSFPGLTRLVPTDNAWNVSGLWGLSVVLGVTAAAIAVAVRRPPRSWLVIATLTAIGAALILLPPDGPLCACGAPKGPDFGWFAYAPVGSEVTIHFGSRWGRWVAVALLLLQLGIAVTQLRRTPRGDDV